MKKRHEEADRKLEEAWRSQIITKIKLLEHEIESKIRAVEDDIKRLYEQLEIIRESVKGIIEP